MSPECGGFREPCLGQLRAVQVSALPRASVSRALWQGFRPPIPRASAEGSWVWLTVNIHRFAPTCKNGEIYIQVKIISFA